MKPHKHEWARLRRKYWRAHLNFARVSKRRRRAYWQHEIKRLGVRLFKLSQNYPPLNVKVQQHAPLLLRQSGKTATLTEMQKALRAELA